MHAALLAHRVVQVQKLEALQAVRRMRSMSSMAAGAAVRILSRRMVRPWTNGDLPVPPSEDIHLTPWDLYPLTLGYIHKGLLLPKPKAGDDGERVVDTLASSLSRALGRYYHLAGRLAVEAHSDGTVTVPLRCTGEGAKLVHAAAPGVAVADIVGSLYTPSSVLSEFFPLNRVLNVDAAMDPVLSAQVTELADGVFVAMSMNHSVGDGTVFWELFNAWSEINRAATARDGNDAEIMISSRRPVLQHGRWFVDTSPVPIPLPLSSLQRHVVEPPRPVQRLKECFFDFSAASVKKLKAQANAEMPTMGTGTAATTISSLQALLAHLWRAACRARRLQPGQDTTYVLAMGCRGRVRGIPAPAGYVGNAVAPWKACCAAGDVMDRGLGWTAWQLNRAVASFDEAWMAEFLGRWAREPTFACLGALTGAGAGLATGGSPRFDVFGNDFGWGKPLAVRGGAGNWTDGRATVYEGSEGGGSMSLDVCLKPDAMERLVADHEFMDAVSPSRGD